MKRDIYNQLMKWKYSPRRKPLLLEGARQTGKTYILNKFGQSEYRNVVYANFETDPVLDEFFHRDLNPERIISDFSIYFNTPIDPGVDLVILDEIQVSNRALNSLKYFAEKNNEIHIASAGSLLGIKLSAPGSFPVGKVNFLRLNPMTFPEFLDAAGESRYRQLLDGIDEFVPLNEAFHLHLIDLLRTYFFTGGMPEAVQHFLETRNGYETREIQNEIIKSYVLDFAKHALTPDIPKLSLIWNSIPKHLARENKKFIFSAMKKGARGRSYKSAMTWLEDANLILRVDAVQTGKHPLKHYADINIFKIYAMDVGLLGAMADASVDLLVRKDRLFNEFEGAFVENYAAQALSSQLNLKRLYYWRSKGGKAELDFLMEIMGDIYPLEVKAGINPRSKSLISYDHQFNPNALLRSNLLNFKQDGKIYNLPLYALWRISSLFGTSD